MQSSQLTGSSQQRTISRREYAIDSPALAGLISYPRYTEEHYSTRLTELRHLGVESILVGNGRSTIAGISIAGKGWVGLVFEATRNGQRVALKIRRTDADRPSMDREAELQQMANGAGVGPKYIAHTGNIILMEYLDGMSIGSWIQRATASRFYSIARAVLEQCRALDIAGLDHGELSRINRHVIVSGNDEARIIDFESASSARRTNNLTSAAQSLFLFGSVTLHVAKFTNLDKVAIVGALRSYKVNKNEESYRAVLDSLGITF